MLGTSAISILHGLGILALVVAGLSMLPSAAATERWRPLILGLALGAAASLTMLDPPVPLPGLDGSAAPAMLAGLYGGPVAALATATLGAATRFWIGGDAAAAAVAALILHCLGGTVAGLLLGRRGAGPDAIWLAALAVISTAASLALLAVTAGRGGVPEGWWLPLSANLLGMLLLGSLLERDGRRRRPEAAFPTVTPPIATSPIATSPNATPPNAAPPGDGRLRDGSPGQTPAGPPPTACPGLHVLVAEDVALNAEILQAMLEQSGHSVRVVSDGRQAVDAVREAVFDVVLMDVEMPGMNGMAATRTIRRLSGAAAAVPIVALTAHASHADLAACLDAGMDDILNKPLERSKLRQVLLRWGARRSAARTPAGNGIAEGAAGLGALLARLTAADHGDREAVRSLADAIAATAERLGFQGLAERARRLTAACRRSNRDALTALIEDVGEVGRRSLATAGGRPPAEGR